MQTESLFAHPPSTNCDSSLGFSLASYRVGPLLERGSWQRYGVYLWVFLRNMDGRGFGSMGTMMGLPPRSGSVAGRTGERGRNSGAALPGMSPGMSFTGSAEPVVTGGNQRGATGQGFGLSAGANPEERAVDRAGGAWGAVVPAAGRAVSAAPRGVQSPGVQPSSEGSAEFQVLREKVMDMVETAVDGAIQKMFQVLVGEVGENLLGGYLESGYLEDSFAGYMQSVSEHSRPSVRSLEYGGSGGRDAGPQEDLSHGLSGIGAEEGFPGMSKRELRRRGRR